MKKILLGALASLVLASPASAADLRKPMPVKAPVIVDPGYNWTGWYAGLNVGYSWGRATTDAPGVPAGLVPVRAHVDGVLGGGQFGYNWQIDRSWVFGLEADIQGTNERERRSTPLGQIAVVVGDNRLVLSGAANDRFEMPWFATFRPRIGWLSSPQTLWYGTAGLAVAEFKVSRQIIATTQLFGPGPASTNLLASATAAGAIFGDSKVVLGWTAGGGVEHKWNKNWSTKLEYLYMDLGRHNFALAAGATSSVKFHDHIVRVGFNYQFDPVPVVAKY